MRVCSGSELFKVLLFAEGLVVALSWLLYANLGEEHLLASRL